MPGKHDFEDILDSIAYIRELANTIDEIKPQIRTGFDFALQDSTQRTKLERKYNEQVVVPINTMLQIAERAYQACALNEGDNFKFKLSPEERDKYIRSLHVLAENADEPSTPLTRFSDYFNPEAVEEIANSLSEIKDTFQSEVTAITGGKKINATEEQRDALQAGVELLEEIEDDLRQHSNHLSADFGSGMGMETLYEMLEDLKKETKSSTAADVASPPSGGASPTVTPTSTTPSPQQGSARQRGGASNKPRPEGSDSE